MSAVSGPTLRAVSSTERDLLEERLDPIDNASYQADRGCMEGTRIQVINDIFLWATRSLSQGLSPEDSNPDGVFWMYGIPGIGKTAIAHSICHRLQESKQLGGTKSVLPTLIYGLATIFGPYMNQMAQLLREDPEIKPQLCSSSMHSMSVASRVPAGCF
ncbi:hypothetical protein M408DRAFT_332254 [Serendipita vermifera MAFF 305830]|uniref:Nephrocystin 3-like N-terminal domain-containing protein n=1 Tax=Serendipita vermifera MAFF 305830 TaxID=933852 RepID=A0A0C3AWP3_SERVB|nr:hypothetical protein M408DRAFT_332254 [Serendipita vermifera MAFF 305830]